jgi:mRNA interferase MazF
VAPPEGHRLQGAILADQLKSLDWRARDAQYFCELEPETVSNVLRTASLLLAES